METDSIFNFPPTGRWGKCKKPEDFFGKVSFDLLVRHQPSWSPRSLAWKVGGKREEAFSKYQALREAHLPATEVLTSCGS